MKKSGKKLLFILLMLALMLPMAQQLGSFFTMKPLKGALVQIPKPNLSFNAFLSSSYQDSMNQYIEQQIGFRPILVRIFNQFRYSVFRHISAKGVVEGKDGYLFELSYIDACLGHDFVGFDKIQQDVYRTRYVNDWLKTNDKHLLVVLAPGKGTFFKEYFPEQYKTAVVGPVNHDSYLSAFQSVNLPVIGCNQWFLSMKDTSSIALYPKSGIHWSFYGMGLVVDSVLKLMNDKAGFRIPMLAMSNLKETEKLRPPDQDIWEGMNILIEPDDYPMAYPEFRYVSGPNDSLPHVITIADSYYWQWIGFANVQQSFRKNFFWYYNNSITEAGTGAVRNKSDVDFLLEIMAADIVMILQTEANMDRFSFGFIDELYTILSGTPEKELERMVAVRKIALNIRKSKEYMNLINEKAANRNISEQEMLLLDAGWIFDQKQKQAVD